jgi:hypothetical protein
LNQFRFPRCHGVALPRLADGPERGQLQLQRTAELEQSFSLAVGMVPKAPHRESQTLYTSHINLHLKCKCIYNKIILKLKLKCGTCFINTWPDMLLNFTNGSELGPLRRPISRRKHDITRRSVNK